MGKITLRLGFAIQTGGARGRSFPDKVWVWFCRFLAVHPADKLLKCRHL